MSETEVKKEKDYSHLPDSVRKQAEESDRLMNELIEKQKQPVNIETKPEETEVKEPEQSEAGKIEEEIPPVEETSLETKTTDEGSGLDTKTEEKEDEQSETWKEKYDKEHQRNESLQGKFVEVPRLAKKLREEKKARVDDKEKYEKNLSSLIARIETLEKEPEKRKSEEKINQLIESIKLKFGEEEAEDLINLIDLKTTPVAKQEEIKSVKQEEEKQKTETSDEDDDFFTDLYLLMPDLDLTEWEKDNITSDKDTWLRQIDPVLRKPRNLLLNKFFSKKDSVALSNLLKQFNPLENTGGGNSKKQDLKMDKLKDHISPPKENITKKTVTAEIIPMAKYNAFIQDCIQGKYRFKQEEKIQLEAKYKKAFEEGRISV